MFIVFEKGNGEKAIKIEKVGSDHTVKWTWIKLKGWTVFVGHIKE